MKAKRLISGVCALAISSTAMAACFSVSAAGEDVVLKGQQIEETAGANFELTIDIAELNGEATQGFSGCEFAIEYDPAQIEITSLTQGSVLDTGATSAELEKAPSIGEEVTMVNKGDYNCFDYNIVSKGDKKVVAVLWCTGLDSSKYWASKEGTLLTINGKVSDDAKVGDKIPVNIIPIDRDGNKDIVFGYIDGTLDKTYTAAVAEQGLITIVDGEQPGLEPLWGDVNDNGSVTASDIVAMIKFILDPEEAGLTQQGICNGNLYQGDGNTDLTSDSVLDVQDLFLLKKYILGDISESSFPMMKIK